MARRSFSKKDRARIFAMRKGRCYLCSGKIDGTVEAFEIEHVIPWEISRDDSDGNLQLAHKKCHAKKTAKDRKDIAKVQRIEAKHKGFYPKPIGNAKIRNRGFTPTRLWPAGNNRDGD